MPEIPRLTATIAALSVLGALCTALWFNGVQLQFLAYAAGLIVGGLALTLWQGPRGLIIGVTPLNLAAITFALWLVLHLFAAQSLSMGIVNVWWVGSLLLTYALLTLSGAARDPAWRNLMTGCLLVGVALAIHSLFQSMTSGTPGSSLFLNRNSLAGFLNLLLWPALFGAWSHFAAERRNLLKCAAFLLATVIMLAAILATGSRGAMLAGLVGAGVGLALWGRHQVHHALAVVAVLAVVSVVLAWLLAPIDWSSRLASLLTPSEAGATRFVIWRQAWLMLQDAPWHGIGLGAFGLAWPPYRDPADTSAGFYAHNDYLQLWIEAGWPALVSVSLIVAAAGYQAVRVTRSHGADSEVRGEVAALSAALTTLALHSLVTFNLYILPILILSGSLLARLQTLYRRYCHPRELDFDSTRFLRPAVYRASLLGIGLIALGQLGGLAASAHLQGAAKQAAAAGDLRHAHRLLVWAHRVAPLLDVPWYVHADLVRATLHATPGLRDNQRSQLYGLAQDYLARAEALNPLRAQIPTARAGLCAQNADLCGKDWERLARAQWRRALTLDPWLLRARIELAKHLDAAGERDAAAQLVRAGLNLRYANSAQVAEYRALAARLLSDRKPTR